MLDEANVFFLLLCKLSGIEFLRDIWQTGASSRPEIAAPNLAPPENANQLPQAVMRSPAGLGARRSWSRRCRARNR